MGFGLFEYMAGRIAPLGDRLLAQRETLVSDNRSLLVRLVDELGDRLLFAYHRLVQQRVLLEELAHLTLGDLLEDSLGLVGVLGILLHGLDGDLTLVLHDLRGAVGLRNRNRSHRRSLHGNGVGDLGGNLLVETESFESVCRT